MESQFRILLDLLLAVGLGFLIGLERKMRSKEAGIRTHTIVCMGAALMMLVSKYGFAETSDFDPSRIAAQIVSGIGFLGAGIIVYRQHEIHGLTTAAGVWATAGVGMA
ncbi:MAG: MgtC/SapB family protein, partial [Candidatus Gallimonas sp.]